jgi:uncharacterized repeat protein (TIGR03803 family)
MNLLKSTALVVSCAGLVACAGGANAAPGPGALGLSAMPSLRDGGAAAHGVTQQTTSVDPTLYLFEGDPNGQGPTAGVVNIGDTLYGTTSYGGSNNLGAVFSISTGGGEQVVHSFAGSDGEYPEGSLLNVNGTLYGTASAGGANTYGCVFSITPSGGFKVVYSFKAGLSGGADGYEPVASLIDYKGALYGTTEGGGPGGYGTVFKIPLSGKQAGKESVVYGFKDSPDGGRPMSALVEDGGAFYGTTFQGGTNSDGTVFKVTDSGKETILHSFGSGEADGVQPTAGLLDYNGTFFGTTSIGGGSSNWGSIFSITKAGKEKILVTFPGGSEQSGREPLAPLTNIGGTIYGTTEMSSPKGTGSVFSMTPSGKIQYLSYFCVSCGEDSGWPVAPESSVVEVGGTLYGTSVNSIGGVGTVWALAP